MTIFHNDSNKNSQTKLRNYIYDNFGSLELSGIETTELLSVFLEEKDYANFQQLADNSLTNGIPFDRSSYVPSGNVYDHGIVPSTLLKFMTYLRKGNKELNISRYSNYIEDTLISFKNQMTVNSGDYAFDPLSTGVLLYNAENSLISDFRAGTYTSDINPLIWLQNGYDTPGMIQYLEDSQKSSNGNFIIDGLFMPYYVRALTENQPYGVYDTFVFDGFVDDINQAEVQYETLSNLAEYCYYGKKFNTELDNNAYFVLINALNSLLELNQLPSNFVSKSITMDDCNITMDNTDITFDQTDIISPEYNAPSPKALAYIGNSYILAYKLKKFDDFYLKAKSIFDELTSLQDETTGNIGNSNFENNLICYKFMNNFNNFYKKDGYDIINSALDMLCLQNIGEANEENHPQNFVLKDFKKSIYELFRNQTFEFERESYTIHYPSDKVNLVDLNIDPHRIQSVEYTNENGSLSRLDLGIYQEYLQQSTANPNPQRPQKFYLKADELFIYPYPNKDYELEIIYFREPKFTNLHETLDFPIEFYPSIKYYIASLIALAISSPLVQLFRTMHDRFIGIVFTAHRSDYTMPKSISSNFNFNNVRKAEGFNIWAGY